MQRSDKISSQTGAILGGRYHLLRLIKAGGMGAVYQARDIKLERPVAVKILSAELTREPGMVRRLFREARAASQVRHPNIVEYLDYDQIADGTAYLVMEFLNGGDLEHILKHRGPIPWPTLAPWIRQACRALSASHAVGIIHRDIKPSNFVLVEPPGAGDPIIKLVDFGIAKLTPLSGLRGDTEMTQHLLGTEMFMAPEMFTGVTPNPRTEVYALGVSVYRLLTGEYPRSETAEPPPPSFFSPGVPPEVDALVGKCLSVHPRTRFDSMEAVDAAIAQTLGGKAVPKAPPRARNRARTTSAPTLVAPPRARHLVRAAMLLVGLIAIAGMFALWPSPAHGPAEPAEPAPLRALASEGPPETPPAAQPAPPVPPETPAPASGEDMRMGEADGKLPQARPATENDGGSTPGPASAPGKTAAPFSTRAALKRLGTLAASARECGEAGDVLPNSTLELTIYIAPSGKGRARAKLETLTHVKCIVQLVNALRFEPSASGGRVIHTYRL